MDSISPSTAPIPSMTPGEKLVLWIIGIACLCGLAYMLTGCSIPTKMRMDLASGEITTTEVSSVVPFTGATFSASEVQPTGMGLLGMLGLGLGAIGALQFAGPKSWANWLAILKPSTSWGTTGHALAANLGLAHTPKESKSNETQKPEITP